MLACICGGIGELAVFGLALAGSVGGSCGITAILNRRRFNARLNARIAAFTASRPRPAVELDPRDVGFTRRSEAVIDRDLACWISDNTTDPRDFA